MEPWAQYQSLLQLAAGTNIAITGLITVYGSEFLREGKRVEIVANSAEQFRHKIESDPMTDQKDLSDIDNSIHEAQKLVRSLTKQEKISNRLVFLATVTCLVASIVSFVLLYVSSIKPEIVGKNIDVYAIILAAPPFFAVSYAALRYLFVTRALHLDSKRIENELLLKAGMWLAIDRAGGNNGLRQQAAN